MVDGHEWHCMLSLIELPHAGDKAVQLQISQLCQLGKSHSYDETDKIRPRGYGSMAVAKTRRC